MKRDNAYNMHPFRYFIELIFVVVTLCILVAAAIQSYNPCVKIAKLTRIIAGSPFTEIKLDMMFYHAHHGEWPVDNDQASVFGWSDHYKTDAMDFIKESEIKEGAVNFFLSDDFKGKILTVRPAVPSGNSIGPVIWVCGKSDERSGWTVVGTDLTDVEDRYLHSSWR